MYAVRPSRPLAVSAFALLVAAFATSFCRLNAQTAPPCTAADLDVALRFGNYGPSTYIIAAISTNISQRACLLSGTSQPEFFGAERSPLDVRIQLQPASAQPVLLAPKQAAHQTLRWSTSAPPDAPACVKAFALNLPAADDRIHPTQIVSPSLLRPICSQVAVEPYATGPTFGDEDSAPDGAAPDGSLHLSSGMFTYHPGESFILHAESLLPAQETSVRGSGMAALRPPSCPAFFVRQRAPDGSTRLEEFSPREYRCSRRMMNGEPPQLDASFDAVPPLQPNLIGQVSLQLSQLAGRLTDPRVEFADSNRILVRIAQEGKAGTSATAAYDGWKTDFALVDTSFGKESALLDQTTHLEWLSLSVTRDKSPKDLDRGMSRHKPLEGWRFATADEVLVLFRHFTNSPLGASTDPDVVHALQSLLGGPLGNSQSTGGGWTRAFTYGRIVQPYNVGEYGERVQSPQFQMEFAWMQEQTQNGETTAVADPHRRNAVQGNGPAAGTFLVRDAPPQP